MEASLHIIDPKKQRPGLTERLLDHTAVWSSGILLDLFAIARNFLVSKNSDHALDRISFFEDRLTLSKNSEAISYSYDKIETLSIKYYTDSFIHRYDYTKHSAISFQTTDNKVSEVPFVATKSQLLEVINLLYNIRVPFKEYRNDQRTFKLDKIGYKEIQDFKVTYEMDW